MSDDDGQWYALDDAIGALPASLRHLHKDAPSVACGRCGRHTWSPSEFGQEDRMTQPDGFPCGGRFPNPEGNGTVRTRTHLLKTLPGIFPDVASGAKTVDLRRNDRGFRVGDRILLLEHDPNARTVLEDQTEATGRYTGRTCLREITHVLPGGQFGLDPDFVALSIRPCAGEIRAGETEGS